MMPLVPLQPALDRFKADWEARVGADIARMIAGDIDALRATGIPGRTARPSDLWPRTDLFDAHGLPFDLLARLAQRPAIVTFYRGGWCPYCNLTLRAWQLRLKDIHAAGADLVAISPELPDHSLTTAQKNDLTFPVLSDPGGKLASSLGLRFTLSDTAQPFYERAGHALPERHGDGVWALPMPATFVVGKGGRIAAAFVEPDYRKRTDPADVIAALRLLREVSAA
jgi:peroxiredoxin